MESFIFVILHSFTVTPPGKVAFKFNLQLRNVPPETRSLGLNNILWTIKNSKEFFKCSDIEAVYIVLPLVLPDTIAKVEF